MKMDIIHPNGQNQIIGERENNALKCFYLISNFEKISPWQHDAD